jgi:hypothetical protein
MAGTGASVVSPRLFSNLQESIPMSIQCPQCGSTQIITRDFGRKTGGAVGTVAGGLTGMSGALSGGRIGMTVGVVAGPVGTALGCLAGALIGGMVGAATVGVAGAKLGEVLDTRVLDNLECRQCAHSFSAAQ